MEAIEALVVARAVERIVFMLCAPLLLYVGYRLFAKSWDDNIQARAELRDNFKFQVARFVPGAACLTLALIIGFVLFCHPMQLSKAEVATLSKLQEGESKAAQGPATPSPSTALDPCKKTGSSGGAPVVKP